MGVCAGDEPRDACAASDMLGDVCASDELGYASSLSTESTPGAASVQKAKKGVPAFGLSCCVSSLNLSLPVRPTNRMGRGDSGTNS